MKTFHCSNCASLVFFENTKCLNCGHVLAYAPDDQAMLALEQDREQGWKRAAEQDPRRYRLCANYAEYDVCNWLVPAEDASSLCASCRLTRTIPDLGVPGSREAWAKLETAKRRLIYALMALQLPLPSKTQDESSGLEFRFLSDSTANGDSGRVLTGHDNGSITINVAEADDVYRETERLKHREPYRTLLGHFRHEIGHYYWDRLVAGAGKLQEFREVFGDERADYQGALARHYEEGPPADWSECFISAYASTHPWEDWAESWAHVMHMVDALETAHSMGLSVRPRCEGDPVLSLPKAPQARVANVDMLVSDWGALTYVLNNLTRGLGLADAYPFVLSPAVIAKLRFVCGCMGSHGAARRASPTAIDRVRA